jgi:elongation factor Ts
MVEGAGAAALVEVNSETDFVAKADDFQQFAQAVADAALAARPESLEALHETPMPALGGSTVETARRELIAKIGENINVRRFQVLERRGDFLGLYLHGQRIGVLVDLKGGDAELARELAMHVAASRPVCVAEADLPPELLDKEREIFAAQAAESGKPPEIVEKMVTGRLKKFVKEVTLLGQPFVKDPDQEVAKLLAARGAEVQGFVRFEVGEGIEKKSENFAEEVMAQAGKA